MKTAKLGVDGVSSDECTSQKKPRQMPGFDDQLEAD
jgi:hypothetical protein